MRILAIIFVILLGACGTSDVHYPGTLTGGEALEQITEAAINGTLLCQLRTGRSNAANLIPQLLEVNLKLYYGIDGKRAYRQKDVDNCKDMLVIGIALSSDCSYVTAPRCYITPVNKITGSK